LAIVKILSNSNAINYSGIFNIKPRIHTNYFFTNDV
jgi:hypothetical protein